MCFETLGAVFNGKRESTLPYAAKFAKRHVCIKENEYFFQLAVKAVRISCGRSPVIVDTRVSLHTRSVFFINSIWGHLFNQNDMTSLSIQFTAQIGYLDFDRDKDASQTIEVINAKPNDF